MRQSENEELITVVIPAYNSEKTLRRAVESVLLQTWQSVEVIVVDDGSADGTRAEMELLASEHEQLIPIYQENAGVSAARNAGIRRASGYWLMTLDADDYMDSMMLEKLYEAAHRGDADLALCGFRNVYEESGRTENFAPAEALTAERDALLNTIFTELYDKRLISTHSNKLYRMELIRKYGIFYVPGMQINEDLDFCLRYFAHCETIAVIRGVYLNYVQHDGGSLISSFHADGVSSCFPVLASYNALFDEGEVDDAVVNAMNNRMLMHICSYAGLMYTRSGYSDEEKLRELTKLCAREEFQELLAQTTPEGLKNTVAYVLLKHRQAALYHKLCKLLYRK